MKKRMAKILAAIAMVTTATATIGCPWWGCEEPQALKRMD